VGYALILVRGNSTAEHAIPDACEVDPLPR
jgi:hypothetical protein